MSVFVSSPMKIATFLRKKGETHKLVVDVLRENTHSDKHMEIVKDFVKSYNNNIGKTLEIVEDFTCEDKTLEIIRDFAFFFIFPTNSFIFVHFPNVYSFSSFPLFFIIFLIFDHIPCFLLHFIFPHAFSFFHFVRCILSFFLFFCVSCFSFSFFFDSLLFLVVLLFPFFIFSSSFSSSTFSR